VRLPDFALERYFAGREHAARHLLGSSDIEGMRLDELLELADPDGERRWRELTLGYTETAGLPALREEIASLYDRIAPDEVQVVSGAEEGIFLAALALLGPGDHVVCAWPSYQSLHEVARGAGAEVTLVELRHEDGWRLDPQEVRRAVRPATRLIVVNAPHNPTGATMAAADLDELAGIAEEAGALLLSDEVYRLMEIDPADRLPAAADRSDRAVSLGVMSKAFGLAGLRIGWIACRDKDVLRRVAALHDYTTICAGAPSEVLALTALRAREVVLERGRAIVRANLPLIDAFMAEHADRLAWVRPRGGCIGFPRLAAGSPEELAERLLREEHTVIVPGSLFGHGGGHFRLGFGRTDLEPALAALARALARWPSSAA
jgi:aspartate/methionine/tyrosine aminotransferase